MNKLDKKQSRLKRKRRIRAKVSGTSERPRLSVYRSLTTIYAQLIDDNSGKTIAQANTKDLSKKGKNNIEGAGLVGELIAKRGKEAKIESVVFDRGGYNYQGKVRSLAEGARKGGLKF